MFVFLRRAACRQRERTSISSLTHHATRLGAWILRLYGRVSVNDETTTTITKTTTKMQCELLFTNFFIQIILEFFLLLLSCKLTLARFRLTLSAWSTTLCSCAFLSAMIFCRTCQRSTWEFIPRIFIYFIFLKNNFFCCWFSSSSSWSFGITMMNEINIKMNRFEKAQSI